jgi:hypothetical protein
MATLISKIVESSGTGHWTTRNLALAANFGASGKDLVAQDENVLNTLKSLDGDSLLSTFCTIDGFTADATRKLTFEVPQEFRHGAAYPITGNKAHATNTGDAGIIIRDDHTSFSDLAIVCIPASSSWLAALTIDGDSILIDRCISVHDGRGDGAFTEGYGCHYTVTAGETSKIRNSIIMCIDATGLGHTRYGLYQNTTTGGSLILENCLVYSTDRAILVRAANGLTLKNCIVLHDDSYSISNPSNLAAASTNNAYVGAAGPNDVNLTGISRDDIFVDFANFDFRLKQGSILRNAGANLISDGVVSDINGNARPGTGPFDIGPHQFQATELSNPVYVVRRAVEIGGKTNLDEVDLLVVEAPTSTVAKDLANSRVENDSSWADATVEEVVSAGDYAGTRFTIRVGGLDILTYTATASQTMANIGTAIAAALAASGKGFSQAAWSGSTLTVAGAGNLKGDQSLEVQVRFPGTTKDSENPAGGIVGTIVDEGAQGSALTVQLLDTGMPRIIGEA